MINALRKRLTEKNEKGFTLIELMVVVLIIGILVAIAIPTFLGAKNGANDKAAESDLNTAMTAEKTFFSDGQAYADSTNATFKADEPSLTFQTSGADAAQNQVDVAVPATDNGSSVCLTTKSKTGTWFGIADATTVATTFTKAGTFYYKGSSEPTCDLTGTGFTATDTSASAGGW